ncbi:MAG: cohesin domain-containing protein [Clostridium sp.]
MKRKQYKILLALALSASFTYSQTAITSFALDNTFSNNNNNQYTEDNSKEESISNEKTDFSAISVNDIQNESDLSEITENTNFMTSASQVIVTISEDNNKTSNSINPAFTITNTSDSDLNLSDLTLRYYYTADSDISQTFTCYYAGTTDGSYEQLTSNVEGSIEKLDSPLANADSCLSITFNGGILKAGQSMNIQTNVNKSDWSNYDKTNDYSYNDSSKVVVYINGNIVSGTLPLEEVIKNPDNPILSMGGITAKGGELVKVPINISNIKDKGISKFHVKISYDPDVFTFASAIEHGSMLLHLPYSVFTGQWHNRDEHTVDIGFDFTKADSVKALYEDGDYLYLPFYVSATVENGTSSFKIVSDAVLTDADGEEYTDNLIVDNKPITLLYNSEAIKNSSIDSNYITYNENTVNDISIPVKSYENTIVSIESETNSKISSLSEGKDYILDNNNLILKKDYLKTLTGENTFITINFNAGNPQVIFVNNQNLEQSVDSLRSISKDEPTVSLQQIINDESQITDNSPITLAITNTSNVNMDLDKLKMNFYYKKSDAHASDIFKIDYSSILGSNKDLTPYTSAISTPFYCDGYYNENCTLKSKFSSKAGVLKPDETVLIHGHIAQKFSTDSPIIRTKLQEPVITYGDDSLYGTYPDQYINNSELITKNIELNADNIEDETVNFKSNGNILDSIELYSQGTLQKKLEKGTDYIINKRNEVILKKSFLDSLESRNSTLYFIFSGGASDSLEILNNKFDYNLKSGSITLSNKESITFGDTGLAGGDDISYWEDLVIPITINNSDINSDEMITSGNFTLRFDKSLFEEISIEPVNCSLENVTANPSYGIINFKINNMNITSDDTALFNIVAHPSGKIDAQKINFTLSDDSYYETSSGEKYKPIYKYNNIELLSKQGDVKLSTEAVSAKQGETISIPVYVDYAKYYNIDSFKTGLLYDTDIFESAEILPGNVFSEAPDDFVSTNNTEKGSVSVVCNNRINKDGTLMNIVLKVKDDAPIGETSLEDDFQFEDSMTIYDYQGRYEITCISNRIPYKPITITAK